MKNLTKFATIAIALLTTLTACKTLENRISTVTINVIETADVAPNVVETQVLWIAPYRQSCVGVTLMDCLMVQKTTLESSAPSPEKWEYFYQDIEGYYWQLGRTNKIKVEITPKKDSPSDSPSLHYNLVEVLE